MSPVATENTGDKYNSQHSNRKAVSRYHQSTPCFVSEKNWNTREDKGKRVLYDCSWLIHGQAMLGWRHQLVRQSVSY